MGSGPHAVTPDSDPARDWASDRALIDAQTRLAAARPPRWYPGAEPLLAAGCFVAFARGEQGPGHPGDHAWGGAALVAEGGTYVAGVAVPGVAGASYAPGLLARREASILLGALAALTALADRPDVVLVDATGRDHPRRAGLALHLGALLDLPTIGVTHRPLVATGAQPLADARGATAPLWIGGDEVARWVRTQSGVLPLVAHAGWRTDPGVAAEVVLRTCTTARTPEPLRQARRLARQARAEANQDRDRNG